MARGADLRFACPGIRPYATDDPDALYSQYVRILLEYLSDTFLQRMRQESDKFWTSRDAKLSRSGLTRQQAYILASIVYEETKRKNEMPRVAGVYVNRLKRGMPLQADPTVKYAVGDFALRRVLNRHLEVDSPYNTYKYPGLPPGPICMPSIDALDGVVDFENHDYLYSVRKTTCPARMPLLGRWPNTTAMRRPMPVH